MSILTDGLEEFDSELKTICNDIQKDVQSVNKSEVGNDNVQNRRRLQTRLTQARMLLRTFKLELGSKPGEAAKYKDKSKFYSDCVEDAAKKLELFTKEELEKAHKSDAATEQILIAAAGVQQESLNKMDNMMVMIEDSKNIGVQAMADVSRQNEQLESTRQGMESMGVSLKLASKLLRGFRRRLVTDKILMVLIMLIVVGVIVIIVVKSIFPSVKVTDVFKSENS